MITLSTVLPTLQDDIVIDGYTQPGAVPNTAATGGLDTVLRIQLDASGLTYGLRVAGSNVSIRGLAFTGFLQSIDVDDWTKAGITIAGNFIGTGADGVTAPYTEYAVYTSGSAGITIGYGRRVRAQDDSRKRRAWPRGRRSVRADCRDERAADDRGARDVYELLRQHLARRSRRGGEPGAGPLVVELAHYNDTGAAGSRRFWGAGTNAVATRIR